MVRKLAVVLSVSSFACGVEAPSLEVAQRSQALLPATPQGGFESPSANGGYVLQPASTEFFFREAGVKGSQPRFGSTSFFPPPQGAQQAFIQAGGGIHRMLNLPEGLYVLSFKLARSRVQGGLPTAPLQVLHGSTVLGEAFVQVDETYVQQAFFVGGGNAMLTLSNPANAALALIDELKLVRTNGFGAVIFETGFEAPNANGSFVFQPPNQEWLPLWGGVAGSAWTPNGTLSAPVGGQFGFVMGGGSLSKVIAFSPGTQHLTVRLVRTTQLGGTAKPFQLFVGGTLVGQIFPQVATSGTTPFVTANAWFEASGNQVVSFVNPEGAHLTLVDDVTVTTYSE